MQTAPNCGLDESMVDLKQHRNNTTDLQGITQKDNWNNE